MPFTVDRSRSQHYEDEQGTRYWSVSEIRKVMHDGMAGIPPSVLEPARLRGTLLHQRFWRVLSHRAGIGPMPPIIEAYPGQCQAMDTWADTQQIVPVKLEEPSRNTTFGYAGCVDTQCLYGPSRILTLTDLKSGSEQVSDPAQLLAYDAMEGYRSDQLLDLYIHADGTYTEKWVTKQDKIKQWPWFLAALNVLKGRRNHGIKS